MRVVWWTYRRSYALGLAAVFIVVGVILLIDDSFNFVITFLYN
jgi:hypothetical protein